MKLSTLFSILLLLATATAIYLGEDHDEDFVLEESLEDDQHIRRLRPAGLNKKKLSRAERQAIRQKKREERNSKKEEKCIEQFLFLSFSSLPSFSGFCC